MMKRAALFGIALALAGCDAFTTPAPTHVVLPTLATWSKEDQKALGQQASASGPQVQRAVMELYDLRQKIRALGKVYR